MKWLRLYSELIDDPKQAKMSDKTFRIFVLLMCLAREQQKDGKISLDEKDIAWRLRCTERQVKAATKELVALEIISIDFDGLTFLNLGKRQFQSDNVNERVKRYRSKGVTLHGTLGETAPEAETEAESETDTEPEGKEEPPGNLPPPADAGVGPPAPSPQEVREELLSRYTPEQRGLIDDCFKCLSITRKAGKISDSILNAELKRWNTIDVNRVMYGITKYLDGEHHLKDKREEYLWGIMRHATAEEISGAQRQRPRQRSPDGLSDTTRHNLEVGQRWLERRRST
ncbi:MAG: hypothetical protein ACLGPL_01055 [Acidobacteriota bacterium]